MNARGRCRESASENIEVAGQRPRLAAAPQSLLSTWPQVRVLPGAQDRRPSFGRVFLLVRGDFRSAARRSGGAPSLAGSVQLNPVRGGLWWLVLPKNSRSFDVARCPASLGSACSPLPPGVWVNGVDLPLDTGGQAGARHGAGRGERGGEDRDQIVGRAAAEGRTPEIRGTERRFRPRLPAEATRPRTGITNQRRQLLQRDAGGDSGARAAMRGRSMSCTRPWAQVP